MCRATGKFVVLGTLAVLALAAPGNSARAAIRIGVVLVDSPRGTEVSGFTGGSTAYYKMGMRRGDVLLTVNGRDVTSASQFAGVLSRNNSIRVSWMRGGRVYRGWASRQVVTGGEGGGEVTTGGEGDPDSPGDDNE